MAKVRGFLTGIIFAAIAVGFAYAMPGAMTVSDPQGPKNESVVHTPKDKGEHPDETDSDETEAPDLETETDENDSGDDADHPTNHGAAVSTAAHCDVQGSAHGELVRSIAQDEDATVADAEAACAAAQLAAAAGGGEGSGEEHGNPDKPEKPEKSKPAHGDDGDEDSGEDSASEQSDVEDNQGADEGADEDDDSAPGNSGEHDNGKDN